MKKKIHFFIKIALFLFASLTVSKSYAQCTSPAGVAGQMQWYPLTSQVRYCNGTSWFAMDNTVIGPTCSGLGKIQFVSSEILWCNGSNWVRTAPAINHGVCVPGDAGKFYYATVGNYYWFCNGSNWRRMAP
ncbi:MAG: hypothetical protein ACK5P7_08810 [Bdellovibrio sp.]|jgi:hypothetical protein